MTRFAAVLIVSSCVLAACGSPDASSLQDPIQLVKVVDLGGDEFPAMVGGLVSLTRLNDGRYILFDMHQPGMLQLFEASGASESWFGGSGQGPTEFLQPWFHHLSPGGDSLFVMDMANGRMSVWSPDGRSLIHTRPTRVSQPLAVVFREDGSLLVNSVTSTLTSISPPVHIVDRGGDVRASMGTQLDGRNPRVFAHRRSLFEDEEGTIWIAASFQYRVERWVPDPAAGYRHEATFSPETVPFPELEDHRAYPLSAKSREGPSPILYGVWREPGGPVWTIVHEPRADWRDRYTGDGIADPTSFSSMRSLWRTRVDALDPLTGEVIAGAVFDENLMGFIGNGEVYSYRLTAAGMPYVTIWRLALGGQ